MSRVFVSYSHEDEEWKDKLLVHLNVIQDITVWDDRMIGVGEDWYPEITHAISKAHIAILLISANFLTSKFILREEIPLLFQRRKNDDLIIIPLLIKPCAWSAIGWLSPVQIYPRDNKALSAGNNYEVDIHLTTLTEKINKLLSNCKIGDSLVSNIRKTQQRKTKINITHLPNTTNKFFGRTKELEIIDRALESSDINVLAIVTWGGAGKTALVINWLENFIASKQNHIDSIYGWSFYSQGASHSTQLSSGAFFTDAFKWFGFKEYDIPISPVDRGLELAQLINNTRTLLILDGIEPLQHPIGTMRGVLKDKGLGALIKQLSHYNRGLCLLTSREQFSDLKNKNHGVILHCLDKLEIDTGVNLLKDKGVVGTDSEFIQAVHEYNGHALSLNLLGDYLRTYCKGDIFKRKYIPKLTGKEYRQQVFRIMHGYSKWLKNQPELDSLYLLGLFDKPVRYSVLKELLEYPVIDNLSNKLVGLSVFEWKEITCNLKALGLITITDGRNSDENSYDCHPLVRHFFADRLQHEYPEAWKQAHLRLYALYLSLVPHRSEKSIDDIINLYSSVSHCCAAGEYREAFENIYWNRICDNKPPSVTRLNRMDLIGEDLSCLSNFYLHDDGDMWNKLHPDLSSSSQSEIFSLSAGHLQSLGRIKESITSLEANIEFNCRENNWHEATKSSNQASELCLVIGDLDQACELAKQGIRYADKSSMKHWQVTSRVTLANTYHYGGKTDTSRDYFKAALDLLSQYSQDHHELSSIRNYQYCDHLLSSNDGRKLIKHIMKSISREKTPLGRALLRIILGRCYLHKKACDITDIQNAGKCIEKGLDELRKICESRPRTNYLLPIGLLAMASFCRADGQVLIAQSLLKEVSVVSDYTGMFLYCTDYHLESARLELTIGNVAKAKQYIITSELLIKQYSYYRRQEELDDLKSKLNLLQG